MGGGSSATEEDTDRAMPKATTEPNPGVDELQRTWETLGKDDPLWAVLSHADKRNGRWSVEEFLATGEVEVAHLHELLMKKAGAPAKFLHVLDFGCGVGRLSLAWSKRSAEVTGVDIAQSMVQRAREICAARANLNFVLNPHPDLRLFPDGRFDLACSLICLQHMPWSIASRYVTEFGRVIGNGGWVVFQIPTGESAGTAASRLRRRLVDLLPGFLAASYRRWRHGTSAVFDMHFTPAAEVERVAAGAGLKLLARVPDESAGRGSEGFLFVFRKESFS